MTTDPNAPDAALLPCAHCGGKAQHYHRPSDDGWSNTDWVSCSDDDCGVSTAFEASKAEAIAAWNRRAGQAHERRADAGLLAALEAENARLRECIYMNVDSCDVAPEWDDLVAECIALGGGA